MKEKHRTSSKITTDRVKQSRHSINQQWHKESLAYMKSYLKTWTKAKTADVVGSRETTYLVRPKAIDLLL